MEPENEKVPAKITFKGEDDDGAVFVILDPDSDEEIVELVLEPEDYAEIKKESDGSPSSIIAALIRKHSVQIRTWITMYSTPEDEWDPSQEFRGSADDNTREERWGRTEWSPDDQ